jgi:hypothetical protein
MLTRNREGNNRRGDIVKTDFKRRCFILEPANDLFQLADVGVNSGCVGVDMRYIRPDIDRILLHV